MKNEIELVPKPNWYANVRAIVHDFVWRQIITRSRTEAGFKCEICGQKGQQQGYNWPTETHEIWEYDDQNHIQKLTGFISLCPLCHKAKHWGRTMTAEDEKTHKAVIRHFCYVNDITEARLGNYLQRVFKKWRTRSKYEWTVDMDFIYEYLRIEPGTDDTIFKKGNGSG